MDSRWCCVGSCALRNEWILQVLGTDRVLLCGLLDPLIDRSAQKSVDIGVLSKFDKKAGNTRIVVEWDAFFLGQDFIFKQKRDVLLCRLALFFVCLLERKSNIFSHAKQRIEAETTHSIDYGFIYNHQNRLSSLDPLMTEKIHSNILKN